MARRLPLPWTRALVALLVSACLTPTDPGAGQVAELRVRATFAPGADPDAMGVTVDSAAVLATPLEGGDAAVDTTVPLTDLEATLSWIVDLDADSAPYAVRLQLRGGGVQLYQGDLEVRLNRLPLGDAPVHDVPVAYVGPGAVASVTVTPGAVTLTAAGAVQQFAAEARDANGTLLDETFTWSTSDAAVAVVDPATGLATAGASGVATITAVSGGVAGNATVTVALGGLTVEIAPASATIPAVGLSRQFTATARDGDGAVIADAVFAWSTGDPAVATVDGSGLATAVSEGATVVSAETGGVTTTVTLQVTVVTTIEVTPANATLAALGATQAFSAVARDANGDPVVGVEFGWTSSDPAVAGVDPASGLATALANGTTTITAAAGAALGSATLTVAQAAASLDVTPESATLTALGATQQFTAIALDANGNPVTVDAAWSSSNPGAATIDAATGLATAVATGEATITAQLGGLAATAQLIVAPGGLTVEITPASATLTALGATRQFTAVARDGNGAVLSGVAFDWETRNAAVLSVDQTGLATAAGQGATWVVAALGDEADSAEVLVTVATVVEVTPATATLAALGATQVFTATARDGNGAVIPGATFVWSSSDPAIAAVDPVTGVATALANGTVTITAQAGDATGTATLTAAQAVAGIAVTPGNVTLTAYGATQQFTAQALDANGNAVTRAVTYTWTSTDPTVATVDPASGLATAVAGGTTGILAGAEGATGGASLTVDLTAYANWATITAAPTAVDANGDDASIITVQLFDGDGNPVTTGGAEVVLATTLGELTPVTDLGNGTYRSELRSAVTGTAVVTGMLEGAPIADDAQVTFTPNPEAVATIEVTPFEATLTAFGHTQQFIAVARNAFGDVLPDIVVAWSSGDAAVAGIDPATGLATAVGNGTVTITAAADGVTGTATLIVAQIVTSVTVTPADVTLTAVGQTAQFTAVARDANGFAVAGAAFIWTTSDSTAVTLSQAGIATAVANGHATIAAASGGVTGTAEVSVCIMPAAPPGTSFVIGC